MTPMKLTERLSGSAAGRQWKLVGIRPHHGIAVPLFSLRTEQSSGIGEYPDLIPLIRWCSETGLDILQLLPLNDTGPESSPYSALSAYALNPIHLGLSSLPHVAGDQSCQEMLAGFALGPFQGQRVEYRAVLNAKNAFLRHYYRVHGASVRSAAEYASFLEDNNTWLENYAIFKAMKVIHQWTGWETWSHPHKDPSPSFLLDPPKEVAAEADYHRFLQYLCFQQFDTVKMAAEQHGVFLKGDIPILINRESADVWSQRQLFHLDIAAGAPPDIYAKDGQNWGFPLYNWERIASQGYQWWSTRLDLAARLYHLYRIDHIVGFYRIWGIPLTMPARYGKYYPAEEPAWIPHGEAIMRVMLERCGILPIGEDLGTVPHAVRENLKMLGICGTKVMRWERRWDGDEGYIDPVDYPAESMTTVSTHDSETLALWWHNRKDEAELFAEGMGWDYGHWPSAEQRRAVLAMSHHSGSLFHINLLQEYLALFPDMVWPNPEDERINIPGTLSDRNWTYRFRPSIEEITESAALKDAMKGIVSGT